MPRPKSPKVPPTPHPVARQRLQLRGALWLEVGGLRLGGDDRIDLLEAIATHGSITHAARAVGLSYRGAWMVLQSLHERADAPVVARSAGGRGGGHTRLTPHGERLVARYRQLRALHARFVQQLDEEGMDLDREFSLLQGINLRSSARNQWLGEIRALRAGAVYDSVELALPGGECLHCSLTRESSEALQLRVKQPALALVKAGALMLVAGLGAAQASTPNRFEAVVEHVRPGAVNAEVQLRSAAGLPLVAVVPQAVLPTLHLQAGTALSVLVAATDVVLATLP